MNAPTLCWQVRIERPVAYDVVKAPRLFAQHNEILLEHCGRDGGRRFVVLDANVHRHYGQAIRAWFAHHGIEARIVVFEGGEEHKSLARWESLLRELDACALHRRDEPVIAIGGGVLTDVAGFAAASYRRGIPHVNVPTTLMGYVDAAIGVKTAVNFGGGKNRLGSFTPPLAVLLDPVFLRTLPRRHLRNGVCEIAKLAIIRDHALFERLEADGAASIDACFANPAGDAILDAAIEGMLQELTPNLFEHDLARRVDFGHTFSCGLEARHAPRLLHGEAVLLDMLASVLIAQRRGLLSGRDADRVFVLVDRLDLQPDVGVLDTEVMWQSLLERIDHRNGQQRLPLPAGLGGCTFVNDLTRRELDVAVNQLTHCLDHSHEFITQH